MFYSQINQDKLYCEYSKNKKNGYFVDIGAHDGIKISNTYKLEKELDWNGICIEPASKAFKALSNNRKCICLNYGIYDINGEVEFNYSENTTVGGITKTLEPNAKQKWGGSWKTMSLPVKTLFTVLEENNAPRDIDYVSLDTEGSEVKILQQFFKENNNKYKIHYIDIETAFHDSSQLKKLMNDNGLKVLRVNQWDTTFIS
jgi:FkbM family methyltransferase